MIGGFVYRGKESRSLRGKYVFGDFSRTFFPGDGRLFWLDTEGVPTDIFEFRLTEFNDDLNLYLFGFGEDDDGELYVLTSTNLGPTGNGGEVWRLVVAGNGDDSVASFEHFWNGVNGADCRDRRQRLWGDDLSPRMVT